MSNSRGYVSYQTIENAYSCVPYIIIYRHGKTKKKELHERPPYKRLKLLNLLKR